MVYHFAITPCEACVILARYVIKTAFFSMLAGVLGLVVLQGLFAYLSELEHVNQDYTALHAFWYTVYRLPYFLVEFMPTGVLLGAVVGLGLLSGNSEIVSMRAAGVSLYRIVGWTMLPALVFATASLCLNEFALAKSSVAAEELKYGKADTQDTLKGYWAMVQTAQPKIVAIDYADSTGKLLGVKQFELKKSAEGLTLSSVLSAPVGTHMGGYKWQVSDVHEVMLDPKTALTYANTQTLTLPIAGKSVHLLTREADNLSISELYAHRQLMTHQGSRSKRHELAFWQKLLSPLSVPDRKSVV